MLTSAIVSLVSLHNRLKQALSRCSGLFGPILSMIRGTQTVNYLKLSYLTLVGRS